MPSQIALFHGTQSLVLQLLMFSVFTGLIWNAMHFLHLVGWLKFWRKYAVTSKALVLFIASVWTTQNWYRLLLQLLTDHSILLPRKDNPLTLPECQELYPLKHSLLPSAWRLSGDHLQREAFLARQAGSSVPHGPLGLINSTIQLWRNGVAGVSKGKSWFSSSTC